MTKAGIIEILNALGTLSSDGVFLLKMPDRSLEYANDSLLKIFDISHKNFATQAEFFVNQIIKEDKDYLQACLTVLLQQSKVEGVKFSLRSLDDNLKHIQCNAYLIDKAKYIIGFCRDITGEHEHENYIINYGAKKNTLLDMVTHNLSAPLHVTNKLLQSLETTLKTENNGRIEDYVQLIKGNTNHCIQLINDFLEEEHLVSENISVKANRFNLVEKVQTILERFKKSYPDYTFNFNFDQANIVINSDDVKLLQTLNNLLSNAVKWSPNGSTIDTAVAEEDYQVTITVQDHGIGIPEKLQSVIFQKNTPASRPGLSGEKSIGMGLYIAKKLVELLNGKISFESKEHEGSVFTITLPKHPVSNLNGNSSRYSQGDAS